MSAFIDLGKWAEQRGETVVLDSSSTMESVVWKRSVMPGRPRVGRSEAEK